MAFIFMAGNKRKGIVGFEPTSPIIGDSSGSIPYLTPLPLFSRGNKRKEAFYTIALPIELSPAHISIRK